MSYYFIVEVHTQTVNFQSHCIYELHQSSLFQLIVIQALYILADVKKVSHAVHLKF